MRKRVLGINVLAFFNSWFARAIDAADMMY